MVTPELNILNVLDYSPPFYGGVGVHLDALGDEMRERGHRLHLAFPREREWFGNARRHASSVRDMPSIRSPIRNGFGRTVRELITAERVDLVHLHFSYAMALSNTISRIRVPLVYHWHNPPRALLRSSAATGWIRNDPFSTSERLTRFVSQSANRALARIGDLAIQRHVVISKEIETLLVESRWIRPEKILCLPNALPALPDQPAEWRERPRPFVLGSVANFREQKDHPTLLRAFSRCVSVDPDLRLDLVGDGETRRRMEALARELGVEPFVRFLGHVHNPEAAYRGMDAFVLSTHYEGQGLVILEAMGHGLPVIATDLPSIRETLPDGEHALLVSPGDPEALADSILSLVRDPALRGALAQRSRATALAARTPRQWAQRLGDLYESIADR